MVVYSHSKLSCYEQCPYKFKLRYIDKVETEIRESIEAFLGKRVHETLEKLYRDLMFQKENSLEDLLGFLHDEWNSNWSDDIVIVNGEYSSENYLRMAEKYISDYYKRYYPFNQGRTIALEERVIIDLGNGYRLQGYIDRLTETKDGYYEIHDYKTNSRLPLMEYIEHDRQLALYMIGVKERYPDVIDVKLVWHFLAFDKEIDSTRSDEQLEELKRDTIRLINEIETDERFEAKPSSLCDWCEFKPVCKQWSHLYKVMEKPENEYLSDSGVQLVNKYAELKARKKQFNDDIDVELKKVEEALIQFADSEDIDVVFGSDYKVKVKESMRFSFPSKHSKKREQLIQLLKKYGKWDEVVQLDTSTLSRIIQEKLWDAEILEALEEYVELDRSKRLYLSRIKG